MLNSDPKYSISRYLLRLLRKAPRLKKENMNHLWLTALVLAAASFLTACGGGSDSPTPVAPAPLAAAEGYYQGTVSSGQQFQLLTLENDQFYSLIGSTDSQGVFRVTSLVEGKGVSNNGSFSASNVKEYLNNGQVVTETLSATYSPKVSITGSVSYAGGSASFSGTAPATANYTYETPASLASVSGNWSGTSLAGEALNFSVATSGALSGTAASGCSFTGTATPRASGKNVLDVSVTFGPAPCALSGLTGKGIGVSSLLSSGKRQFLIAMTNTDRTAGTVVFAQR